MGALAGAKGASYALLQNYLRKQADEASQAELASQNALRTAQTGYYDRGNQPKPAKAPTKTEIEGAYLDQLLQDPENARQYFLKPKEGEKPKGFTLGDTRYEFDEASGQWKAVAKNPSVNSGSNKPGYTRGQSFDDARMTLTQDQPMTMNTKTGEINLGGKVVPPLGDIQARADSLFNMNNYGMWELPNNQGTPSPDTTQGQPVNLDAIRAKYKAAGYSDEEINAALKSLGY